MKILHLEDNLRDAETVRAMLTEEFPSCHVTLAVSRGEFLAALVDSPGPDIVLCDFALPGFDGLRALEMVREHRPDSPLIFLSGSIGEERAITALRAGAYDYVLKDNLARLPVAVRHALGDFAQRRRHREDELRLQELVGVIERAGEAIVVSDMMGRITLWNDGAARLYGRPASAALGRRVEEVLSHADFPCFAPPRIPPSRPASGTRKPRSPRGMVASSSSTCG